MRTLPDLAGVTPVSDNSPAKKYCLISPAYVMTYIILILKGIITF